MRERQTVVVESEGVLPIPESLREEMGLRPGDILSVEGIPPHFLWLAPYREVLTLGLPITDRHTLMGFVLRFLALPLTAVEEDHSLHIPTETFPLPAGSRLKVSVAGDLSHRLDLYREMEPPRKFSYI